LFASLKRARAATLVATALSLAGCEDKRSPPPPPSESKNEQQPAFDAGILGEAADPPPPPGDLRAEIDAFVNVDQCVGARAKLDPLVGDALSAIGYETFLRDACRLLEAAKDRKRETCDRIDSSGLRSRCESWVAMIAQTPDACPLAFEGIVTRGRDPGCVAASARDVRLCQGEPSNAQRTSCEALVLRDPTKCDALVANQRATCRREVTRWRTVLAAPLEGLDKLPTPIAKLSIHGASGTSEPAAPDVDASTEVARGVVVVTASGRKRIEIGAIATSEAARIAPSPLKKGRFGLVVLVDGGSDDARGSKKAANATLEKLEIELPGEAPVVSPPGTCDCKLSAHASPTRGGEMALSLDGTVTLGTRSYKIAVEATTFVRDVVAESAGTRVLPPVHPPLPGGKARER
jgi:hypothetical protein